MRDALLFRCLPLSIVEDAEPVLLAGERGLGARTLKVHLLRWERNFYFSSCPRR